MPLTVIEGTRNETAARKIQTLVEFLGEAICTYEHSLDAQAVAHHLANLWFLAEMHIGPQGKPPWRIPANQVGPASGQRPWPRNPAPELPPVITGNRGYRRAWPVGAACSREANDADDMIARLDERA